jgi:hypothetical protein
MGFHIMNHEKALWFTMEHFLHDAECILESGTPVSLGLAERHRRAMCVHAYQLCVCLENHYLHNLYINSRDEPTFDQRLETFGQHLEDGYCSIIVVNYECIIVVNYELIRLVRSVTKRNSSRKISLICEKVL